MASNPTIKPRRGTTAPGVGAINQNELAVDTTNKRIYIGAADGSGTLIGAAPGGSDTQVQFNDGGNLSGDSGLTYNKTTDTLTITGDLSVNGGDITSSATTFNLLNSTVTSLNIGGAATTMAIGNTATAAQTVNMFTASTGASTYNFATGATAASTTKTLNIGTGGSGTSLTNINIGTGSSGSPTVVLGSTSGGSTSFYSPDVYFPSSVYFGSPFVPDNAIFSTTQTMFTDASITLYTSGTNMYLGGENTGITVMIGDYEGWNDGTLITVDELNNVITLHADSGVTVNQDLAVNGGDITTTVTGTATLFNTNATTLNLGGVATAITMGATSGTTTTIRGGTLVGNTTTQNVFNTTATTVNAFGAATTVNMGGASTNTVFAGTVEIDGTNALQFPDGTVQVTRTPDFILFDFGII